ncbi:helix-turn-helix transcriptional regulator [Paenibacillus peoriae]|uniref:Helix-turn-helix transcriptional regulator n=2 Tax=Paenibacillus peoriae TaxID=59893 RepID=A0A7H0Y3A4_9BACL|nr:helix-turn-helix transcriptional regulator [Paenibacillus peoriae]
MDIIEIALLIFCSYNEDTGQKAGMIMSLHLDLNLNSIGKRIKVLRIQHNISMSELAEALNIKISQSTISNIESDKVSPNAEVIIALSQYFNVSTDWLLTGNEWSKPAEYNIDDENELMELIEDTYNKAVEMKNAIWKLQQKKIKIDLRPKPAKDDN